MLMPLIFAISRLLIVVITLLSSPTGTAHALKVHL
jgi:hypothetical protein